jgi:hypothetical protein
VSEVKAHLVAAEFTAANFFRSNLAFGYMIWSREFAEQRAMVMDMETRHVYLMNLGASGNWDTLYDRCNNYNTEWSLPSVTSTSENDVLRVLLRSNYIANGAPFGSRGIATLAAQDAGTVFKQRNGEPLMFADFAPGQPAISGRQTLEFKAYDDYRFR